MGEVRSEVEEVISGRGFHAVLGERCTQHEVFEAAAADVVEAAVVEGVSATVLVHGSRGSGKTFTMKGVEDAFDAGGDSLRGVLPRAAEQLFACMARVPERHFATRVSMLQFYEAELEDLLHHDGPHRLQRCQVRATPNSRSLLPHVQDLSSHAVSSPAELLALYEEAFNNLRVQATSMERCSSRSTVLCIISIVSRSHQEVADGSEGCCAELVLGELAALDPAEKRANPSTRAFYEVVRAAATSSPHLPYRIGRLTMLLREALGGKMALSLIITCSPDARDAAETHRVLQVAQEACRIHNWPEGRWS